VNEQTARAEFGMRKKLCVGEEGLEREGEKERG